jgi:hypothetical protein
LEECSLLLLPVLLLSLDKKEMLLKRAKPAMHGII